MSKHGLSTHSSNEGLLRATEQVRDFHQKHGFDCEVGFSDRDLTMDSVLEDLGQRLVASSSDLEKLYTQKRDPRLLRAHLMLEELGETLAAMAFANVDGFYDGLADLVYVALGSAVTVGPRHALAYVFDEVHRSNMTKEAKNAAWKVGDREDDDPRLRNKGKSFVPPNISAAIKLALRGGDPSLKQWRVASTGAVNTTVVIDAYKLDGSLSSCSLVIQTVEMMAFIRAMSVLGIVERPGVEGDGS